MLEKSLPGHRDRATQIQHASPMCQVEPPDMKAAILAEGDEDNDIDLFGSNNEEEDKEAAGLWEKWLWWNVEKKAKKTVLVVKSSILLDIKPWDNETNIAQLEACMHFIQLDGLL
ncbi:elongation factor 1-delta-like [Hylobates moloch]|uniref:elongation factor 1-delta-like n=1 Tax=Hylobates moloch TaxID=81572 RepID=UPI00267727B2|nr:elongation factor 1-delta-like [Hylobates moloch]